MCSYRSRNQCAHLSNSDGKSIDQSKEQEACQPDNSALYRDCIEHRFAAGHRDDADAVAEAIRAACPKFCEDWGCRKTVRTVHLGLVPAAQVLDAIDRFRKRFRLGCSGELEPLRDPKSYLAGLLKQVLGRHGVDWTNNDEAPKRKQA